VLDPGALAPLPRSFYERPVLEVARDAVGKRLVHVTQAGVLVGRIVETEAYRGPEDRAAHSFGGRRTARTEAMFGPAGRAYIFLVYGLHWHLNLVTGREGEPHAVLIRAVEPLLGQELMALQRGMSSERRELTNGPGKVCAAFGIDRRWYGTDLTEPPLYLSDGPRGSVHRSPRIGVDYALEWAEKPWRFYEAGNPYVSRAPRSRLRP
jgi:DNA-3-methyladenine glycosylase